MPKAIRRMLEDLEQQMIEQSKRKEAERAARKT